MFTFELINGAGVVWDVVTVRADGVTAAAATLTSVGLDLRLV